jgi:hypothetical protein
MGKSNDIILELEGHFWWYGETIPEGQYAPPSALPGVLTISEDGLGKLVVTGSRMRSEPIKLDNAGREPRRITSILSKDAQSRMG